MGSRSQWVFPVAWAGLGHAGNPVPAFAHWEKLGHLRVGGHDLRRTYAGTAASVLQPFDVAVLFDHRGGGQTFYYARDVCKMRRSVAKVAKAFDRLIDGREAAA